MIQPRRQDYQWAKVGRARTVLWTGKSESNVITFPSQPYFTEHVQLYPPIPRVWESLVDVWSDI